MKKNKCTYGGHPLLSNGFTLIELLAVIVILAIIALIAIPRIADIIDNSEESATLSGGRNYLRAVEQAILNKNLKEKFNPSECEIQSDGNLVCDGKLLEIEMTGNRPTEGTITIEKKVPVAVDGMLLDGYVLNMTENGNLEMFGRVEDITPQGTYLMLTPNRAASSNFLGQDKIKKNQVEKISIKNRRKVPSNAIYSWDVSEAQDNSVIAWYADVDNNGLYELYIGGEGGVKANPDSSYLFQYFSNVTTIDVTYLNTSEVTKMNYMFYMDHTSSGLSNTKLERIIGLNRFNTSKVTEMTSMFNYCSKLTEIDVSSFDTTNVKSMSYMFAMGLNKYYGELNNIIGLEKLDTGNVTNMGGMFQNCSSLTNLDLSRWNTSNVTHLGGMFQNCIILTNLDLSGWNTSNVTSMGGMFQNCSSLTNLNLENFNTSNVTSMSSMFSGCKKLTKLDLENFDTSKVTNMNQMFDQCTNLVSINLSNADTSNVTTTNYMFRSCSNLQTINMKSASFNSVTSYTVMFDDTSPSLSNIIVKDTTAKTFIEARLTDARKTGVTVTIA